MLLVLLLVTVVSSSRTTTNLPLPCVFPTTLRNAPNDVNDYWILGRRNRGDEYKLVFNENTLSITGNGIKDYGKVIAQGRCVKKYNDTTYDLNFQLSGNPKKQRYCVTIVTRTANVFQLQYDPSSNKSCNEVGEGVLDPDLVVANMPRKQELYKCTVPVGGYYFGTNVDNNECKFIPFPSRMESECSAGEGITFSFFSPVCVPPKTGWSLDQTLQCFDSWTYKGYKYMVMGEKYYEPRYVLRYGGSLKSIMVSLDLVAIHGAALDNYELFFLKNVTQANEECHTDYDLNLCNNYKDRCNDVGSYCPNTCQICGQGSCKWDPSVVKQGNYTLGNYGGVFPHNKVIDSIVDFDKDYGLGSYGCTKKVDKETYVVQPIHLGVQAGTTMIKDNAATCRRKSLCMKFAKRSESVLSFKLSQPSVLTITDDTAYDICSDSKFSDDPLPYTDYYRSRSFKNIISNNPSRLAQTVPCGINGEYNAVAPFDNESKLLIQY